MKRYAEEIKPQVWINSRHQEGTLAFDTVISIIKQIANALEYVYGEDIYPNIRPENINIDAVGHIKVKRENSLHNGIAASSASIRLKLFLTMNDEMRSMCYE